MVLIKCCDISNEIRPMEVAEPWVDCLLEEYFMQVRVHLAVIVNNFNPIVENHVLTLPTMHDERHC